LKLQVIRKCKTFLCISRKAEGFPGYIVIINFGDSPFASSFKEAKLPNEITQVFHSDGNVYEGTMTSHPQYVCVVFQQINCDLTKLNWFFISHFDQCLKCIHNWVHTVVGSGKLQRKSRGLILILHEKQRLTSYVNRAFNIFEVYQYFSSLFTGWTFYLNLSNFHEYLIQHSLKSGDTKDHFRQGKVPDTYRLIHGLFHLALVISTRPWYRPRGLFELTPNLHV
jgi:hypothetical protein